MHLSSARVTRLPHYVPRTSYCYAESCRDAMISHTRLGASRKHIRRGRVCRVRRLLLLLVALLMNATPAHRHEHREHEPALTADAIFCFEGRCTWTTCQCRRVSCSRLKHSSAYVPRQQMYEYNNTVQFDGLIKLILVSNTASFSQ